MSASPARYQPVSAAPSAHASQISQATAIEQSRAVAEVQAAVLVAQQNRRNKPYALAEMREVCGQKSVAERAFFRFPRGGKSVTGPTIHLARELARCWGNIQYGVAELRRDDTKGESEMQAFAWDLETNARTATTFIVPHKRDTDEGARQLASMRDIYENNANNGARRVREAIFSVLPGWFVEEAQELCRATLQGGGGVPLAQRIANSLAHFEQIGVTRDQLEQKVGRPSDQWTDHDVTELGITFTSIKNGELSKDEEFGARRATVAVEPVKAESPAAEPPAPEEPPAEEDVAPADPEPADPEPLVTDADLKRLYTVMSAKGIRNVEERKAFIRSRVGDPDFAWPPRQLTRGQLDDTIAFLETGEEPVADGNAPA